MNDLHARFRTFDALDAPSLWTEIEVRSVAARRPMQGSLSALLAAAALLVLAIVGGAISVGSGLIGRPTSSASPSPRAVASVAALGVWTTTGSMAQARHGHTATLLPDGRVLVAGGFGRAVGGPQAVAGLASAELYDPTTGSWVRTGSLGTGRGGHSSVLLGDGTVLVVGGASLTGTDNGVRMLTDEAVVVSAELYDPQSGAWTTTGSMAQARSGGTATLLADGRVLVAGGWAPGASFGTNLASAELYDPATRTWTTTGSMAARRNGPFAVLLPNGKVLVAGGYDTDRLASAELYDPASGTWSITGGLPEKFLTGAGALLRDGTVLIAGGDVPSGPGAKGTVHAALYDISAGTWKLAAPMTQPRLGGANVLLLDGRLLVAGGKLYGAPKADSFADAELYDPGAGTWTAITRMTVARGMTTATLLQDGRVLVVGGPGNGGVALASAELFELIAGT